MLLILLIEFNKLVIDSGGLKWYLNYKKNVKSTDNLRTVNIRKNISDKECRILRAN